MSSTQSTTFFTGLRDDLVGLTIDLVRARHIDTEQFGDNEQTTDAADLRAGFTGRESFIAAPGGIPLSTWAVIGAAVVGGVIVFKRVL